MADLRTRIRGQWPKQLTNPAYLDEAQTDPNIKQPIEQPQPDLEGEREPTKVPIVPPVKFIPPLQYDRLTVVGQGVIRYNNNMQQVAIMNQSGAALFISMGRLVDATGADSEYSIPNNRYFVSPILRFIELFYAITGTIGSFKGIVVVSYPVNCVVLSPGMYAAN